MNKKQFIQNFNFPEPNWSTLPEGFPDLSKKGLTKMEGHLLDGIKLAWATSEGRDSFYKRVARRAIVTAVIVFVLFVGKNLVTNRQTYTKTVNAKTVTAAFEDIVESTRSALFR